MSLLFLCVSALHAAIPQCEGELRSYPPGMLWLFAANFLQILMLLLQMVKNMMINKFHFKARRIHYPVITGTKQSGKCLCKSYTTRNTLLQNACALIRMNP